MDRGVLDGELAEELAHCAIELATGAAALVRERSGGQQRVWSKSSDTDLVTATDAASEAWIVAELARRRPDDAILGEEGGERPGSSPVRWVVDPLDGTVNFVLGIARYAVSIAAEVDGQVVTGAVCNVPTGELFTARLGAGAYVRANAAAVPRRLHGPRQVPLRRAVLGTGFAYDAARRQRQVAVTAALLPRIADIRRLGSAALDLCAVAAGQLDGYFEVGLGPWDFAAGLLIAQEAGVLAAGVPGLPPGPELVVAGGPELFADLCQALAELGIAQVL